MPVNDKGTRYFYHDTRWEACRRCGVDEELRFGVCWDCGAWYWYGWKIFLYPIHLVKYIFKPIVMRLKDIDPACQTGFITSVPGGAAPNDPDIGK